MNYPWLKGHQKVYVALIGEVLSKDRAKDFKACHLPAVAEGSELLVRDFESLAHALRYQVFDWPATSLNSRSQVGSEG
jgi:hypothetical protein